MAAGGTKLPRSRPCSSSSASQAASATSVLRPGRTLTDVAASTNRSSKPRSSSTYTTGFQYWPVALSPVSAVPTSDASRPLTGCFRRSRGDTLREFHTAYLAGKHGEVLVRAPLHAEAGQILIYPLLRQQVL